MPIMLSAAPMASVFCAILLRVMSASFETGIGTKLDPGRGIPGPDGVSVKEASSARAEQAQMAVHRVLVQRDQQIHMVAQVGDRFGASANGQKRMAAANDGLVGVVSVDVQPTAAKDLCEYVAWSGNTLTCCSADSNSEGLPHKHHLRTERPELSEPGAQPIM